MALLSEDKPTLQLILEVSDTLINSKDADGNTAMHLSIIHPGTKLNAIPMDLMKTLLFFYPNLAVKNNNDESLLYCAAKHHAWDKFHLLLQNGARLDLSHPKSSDSMLLLAFRDKNNEAIKLLFEKDASVHEIDFKVRIIQQE